jgi:ribosomal protein S6E (S10)
MKGHRQVLAVAGAVLALPLFLYSQTSTNSGSMQADQAPLRGHHEAALMKPASATLVKTLDAAHEQPGATVNAKLQGKVGLTNGTELPGGTMLLGKVAVDDMQQAGRSKLALRFDQARLKDGTTVPIRATIVGFYSPGGGDAEINPGDRDPMISNNWTAKTLQMDQEDAAPGVDLHSKISSHNSGVFVSSKKDDIKLRGGSELQLAIAPANNPQSGMTAGGQS